MRRVWTSLLFVLTAVVAVGVGYVIMHRDQIPQAGQTPGYPPAPTSPTTTEPTTSEPTTREPTTGQSTATRSSDTPQPIASGAATGSGDPAKPVRVTFLGDDWVAGVGSSASSTPWTHQVSERLGITATAVGVDGAGYAQQSATGQTYAGSIDRTVRSKPDVVVVLGGRNDVGDDGATLRQGATSLFAELHRRMPRVRLFAIAPFWGDSPHPAKLTPVDDAVRAGVDAAGGTYLDVADPIAGHPSWMADQSHPDDRGYQAIADAVAAALRPRVAG